MKDDFYTYSGIIHVHSTYSDGTRSIPEIAAIANEVDADFLLFSDHNTLQAKLDGLEGWYGNVLVGIGSELNDPEDKNHFLAFDIQKPVGSLESAEQYICRVREQGGLGIIAHPNESRGHIQEYPAYPWTLWRSDCFDGIELWNHMSEWMEGLTHKNKYIRVLHPRRSIIAPKPETLAKWDELNIKRPALGIGGVDAHGFIHRLWGVIPLRIFRYKVSFRTIRTYTLCSNRLSGNDDQKDLKEIYSALRSARCFVAHRYFGDPKDFRFWAENNQDWAQMGETLILKPNTKLWVHNPQPADTRLIFNGKTIGEKKGRDLYFKINRPGAYRIETRRSKRLWILSNHIRLA